jgi:hypothetical protein
MKCIVDYIAAFNERDPGRRRVLIAASFAPQATIHLFTGRVIEGREGLAAEIAAFRERAPDDVAMVTSDIEQASDWLRFTGHVRRPDGSTYSDILDVCEIGDDGRIARILTFSNPR